MAAEQIPKEGYGRLPVWDQGPPAHTLGYFSDEREKTWINGQEMGELGRFFTTH